MVAGERKKVVLDTSFLNTLYDYKLDIFTKLDDLLACPYDFVIPQAILDELHLLSINPSSKSGRGARLVLQVLERIKYEVAKEQGRADKAIEKVVEALVNKGERVVVCSLDKALLHRLKRRFPAVALVTVKGKTRVGYV